MNHSSLDGRGEFGHDKIDTVMRGGDGAASEKALRSLGTGATQAAAGDHVHTLVLGYAEATSSQGSITTEADLSGLTVTVTVPEGHYVRVSACVPWQTSAAPTYAITRIKEDTVTLQVDRAHIEATGSTRGPFELSCILTPTAGSHTYKLTGARGNLQSETLTMAAAAGCVAYILVEDLGPA